MAIVCLRRLAISALTRSRMVGDILISFPNVSAGIFTNSTVPS